MAPQAALAGHLTQPIPAGSHTGYHRATLPCANRDGLGCSYRPAAKARWLAERDFVIAVSCDGTPGAHDTNRVDARGCGSHALTQKGLSIAIASGAKVRVVLVLHPANVAALPDSVRWLVEHGAEDLVVNPDWSASWDDTLLDSWASAYERVASMYIEAFRQGRPFWISTLDPKIATHIRGGYTDADRCDLGRRNLVVAPSGYLYPCDRLVADDTDHRHVLGHVDTGPDLPRVEGYASAVIDMPRLGRGRRGDGGGPGAGVGRDPRPRHRERKRSDRGAPSGRGARAAGTRGGRA
jgi:hypothetical protein